jgi:hypothetical protein
MSLMYITEYERMAETTGGFRVSAGVEPAHATQVITFTAAAGQSANFNARTRFVRIHVDGIASLLFGANPTAVANTTTRLTAGQTEYFGCDQATVATGLKVSAVTST